MNILFLTLLDFDSIHEPGIYQDLMAEFERHGHSLFIVSPVEKRKEKKTHIIKEGNVIVLKLKIGNTQKTNIVEKGISTLCIEPIFIYGIKKYFAGVKFDLILYSTPPITFCRAIEYVKKRDGAKTYLLLKDIFPQNAVDIGMLSKRGAQGLLYRFFRSKEKRLYQISDYIGCMSQANVDYIIKKNPQINPQIVEVCPNSINVVDKAIGEEERINIRHKYGIPLDKKIFVYGGNLGKPQGIKFLIECLESQKDNDTVYFLIIGDGTEYKKIESYVNQTKQKNVRLMKRLPKEDYDSVVAACNVGMIFLDHRFTIPNFPSRLLSYMQAKVPVLAVTDKSTDIGKVVIEGGFGWWCESKNVNDFSKCISEVLQGSSDDVNKMKENEYRYLLGEYSVEKTYYTIIKHL